LHGKAIPLSSFLGLPGLGFSQDFDLITLELHLRYLRGHQVGSVKDPQHWP
jgi:hypothetical protein